MASSHWDIDVQSMEKCSYMQVLGTPWHSDYNQGYLYYLLYIIFILFTVYYIYIIYCILYLYCLLYVIFVLFTVPYTHIIYCILYLYYLLYITIILFTLYYIILFTLYYIILFTIYYIYIIYCILYLYYLLYTQFSPCMFLTQLWHVIPSIFIVVVSTFTLSTFFIWATNFPILFTWSSTSRGDNNVLLNFIVPVNTTASWIFSWTNTKHTWRSRKK